jgi:Ca2+:H+ antiporter
MRLKGGRSARLKYLRYLLIFVPIAVAAELLGWDALIIFSCWCIALVPLAGLLGEATEELAIHTGPKIG